MGLVGNTSAVGTSAVWGEGDVLRKRKAGLYCSETPSPVVNTFADVGTAVRGINWVVASVCTWFLLVVTAPSVEICDTRIPGLVGKSCFPAIVCTVVGPAIRGAVLDWGLGVVTGGCEASRVVAVKAGGIWAKLVLVAGRVCSVEDSGKTGGRGVLELELIVSASGASVGRDSRLGAFDSVTIFLWGGLLWFFGSAV